MSNSKYRIAIAGFQHETNTFSPFETGYCEFEIADSWPNMLHGSDVITNTKGLNLPVAGFVQEAEKSDICQLAPILWCAAEPGSYVTKDAFDRIMSQILSGLEGFAELDAIYLDLHGAMVTAEYPNGEVEILKQIREQVGPELAIGVSLDLHANISEELIPLADTIAIYRTYPHLDMAETGARCYRQLIERLDGKRPVASFRQVPYLIPMHAQDTNKEPCKALYERAIRHSQIAGQNVEISLGFTGSDTQFAGPSILTYVEDQHSSDAIADELLMAFEKAEDLFDGTLKTEAEAVTNAIQSKAKKPIVIADVQDNPGGGGTSDTTGILMELVKQNAKCAVVGLLCDPEIAQIAHDLGEGARFTGALGNKFAAEGQNALEAEFIIEKIDDGNCPYTGAMYGGGIAVLGKSAVLKVKSETCDVRVIVTSQRSQCLDLGLFTHFGIEPERCKILVVKSTLHFRADFEPIAEMVINCGFPGALGCDLTRINYKNLRDGIRLGPNGPPFQADFKPSES